MSRKPFLAVSLAAGSLVFGLILTPGLVSAQTGSTFSGQVVDTNGQPVSGAGITVDGTSVDTDSDGDFSLNVPSGSYTAEVTDSLGGAGNYQAYFPIDLSASLTGQALTVPAALTMTTQVTDADGDPVSGVYVDTLSNGRYAYCTTPSFDIMPGVATSISGPILGSGSTDSNGEVSWPIMPCATVTGQVVAIPSQSSGLVQASTDLPSSWDTDQSLTIFGRGLVDVCVKFHAVRARRARLA